MEKLNAAELFEPWSKLLVRGYIGIIFCRINIKGLLHFIYSCINTCRRNFDHGS